MITKKDIVFRVIDFKIWQPDDELNKTLKIAIDNELSKKTIEITMYKYNYCFFLLRQWAEKNRADEISRRNVYIFVRIDNQFAEKLTN